MKLKAFLLVSIFVAAPAFAQEPVPVKKTAPDKDAIITVSYENDIFVGNDSNYTSGIRVSYFSPETTVPRLLEMSARAVPFFLRDGHARWGMAVGQNIYSPD